MQCTHSVKHTIIHVYFIDDVFYHDEYHIVECDDNLEHHSLVSQESYHGDDDSNMEAQILKQTVDEDDFYES